LKIVIVMYGLVPIRLMTQHMSGTQLDSVRLMLTQAFLVHLFSG
jgi:hypothetical protein